MIASTAGVRRPLMMATTKQLTLIQDLDIEKRSCASRQFAYAQRQNIARQDEEAAARVLGAKSGDGHAFNILIERYQRRISPSRPAKLCQTLSWTETRKTGK